MPSATYPCYRCQRPGPAGARYCQCGAIPCYAGWQGPQTQPWPRRVNDGRGLIWACCVSSIGPACGHMRGLTHDTHEEHGPDRWVMAPRFEDHDYIGMRLAAIVEPSSAGEPTWIVRFHDEEEAEVWDAELENVERPS